MYVYQQFAKEILEAQLLFGVPNRLARAGVLIALVYRWLVRRISKSLVDQLSKVIIFEESLCM